MQKTLLIIAGIALLLLVINVTVWPKATWATIIFGLIAGVAGFVAIASKFMT